MTISTASSNETAPSFPEFITSLAPDAPQSADVIPAEAGTQLAEQPSNAEVVSSPSQPAVIPNLMRDPSSPHHPEPNSTSSPITSAVWQVADTVFRTAAVLEDKFFKLLKPIPPFS